MDPSSQANMAATVPAETQQGASVTPSYRRNGKLYSCEPCRRGKLRCDHTVPVCGRCARRNKPEQCIYHPAPLTRPRMSPSFGPQRPSPAPSLASSQRVAPYQSAGERLQTGYISPPSSTSTLQKDYSAFRPVNRESLGQTSVIQSPAPPVAPRPGEDRRTSSSACYASPESAMSFRDSRTGFLGPTAYSAVYTENPRSLSMIEPDTAAEADDSSHLPPLSAEKIQQGVEVLKILRDMPVYGRFTKRWFDLCDGLVVMRPVFKTWIDELWAEFGIILTEGTPEQLSSLSELIWRNTRRPLKTHGQMTAREWAKSASGLNLRWEVVGIFLSTIGLIAVNLSNWDMIFDSLRESFVDRATFAERMRKGSGFCQCFCYECEVLNDIYICFMYEDLILVNCLKGDAHYFTWQRTGELCDAIIALGLHQGNPVDAEIPFFLAQLRRRIFISAYSHDKVVATFLGRPPRLSYRYCKMEMPLDLSDEQLFSEGAELEAILSTLDPGGWNTNGNLNRATWLRVWFQECRVREEILEIALGSEGDDIRERADQLRVKLEHMHASFPSFMKTAPEEVLNASDSILGAGYVPGRPEKAIRQINALYTLCIHAGVMHTEFLLQRAMINRLKTDTKELIPVSSRMLKLVLLAQTKRDFFRDFQGDLVYLLAVHGLPSAGVLAIELLKQEQSRQYTPDILPRSETIQDLSVFISSLAAVGPGEGNFSICNQGRRALKRVLDQILSPTLPPTASSNEQQPMFDDMSLYFPTGNDAEFLHWLENVEWDKGLMNPAAPAPP